ncbi:hypothetical protein BJX63DRAFT_380587 [Aspergillus granulosus]|uniref:Uncharacterized protein n=1 Tax=Aspergillus granulosus TaxID=176169 RepID=A0ABR4HXZ5_9EURO
MELSPFGNPNKDHLCRNLLIVGLCRFVPTSVDGEAQIFAEDSFLYTETPGRKSRRLR